MVRKLLSLAQKARYKQKKVKCFGNFHLCYEHMLNFVSIWQLLHIETGVQKRRIRDFFTMEKLEIRGVIKYLHKKGLSGQEIHNDMVNVLGESAPSYATVKNWVAEFKRGRTSIEDEPRSGRPKTATTTEIVAKVHDMVLNDRRIKVREIANIMGISNDRVHLILHEELQMKKLSARWVPHLLTVDQKRIRMKISQACLDRFKKNKMDFKRRFITVDETWIHHYTPETKEQSKQWTEAGGSAPKKAKTIQSAGKVMATVFWDFKGILLIDYLQKGKTINSEYYCNILDQLNVKIREKRPGLQHKKIIFHQDNAPAHKSVLTMAKINELKYELLDHPPYSPDLAPSDFYLFPNLKKFLAGKRFTSNEDAITVVNHYFEGLEENYFNQGIELLDKRWTKCIEVSGDYIEK